MKNQDKILKLVFAAMFLALAYVMPYLTGQIPEIGSMLCPMHIPVILCGFICGWPWGLLIGFIAPLLRSLTLGMPVLFPMAFCMAFELATYGATAGFMYKIFPKKKVSIYASLLIAMITGRIMFGISMYACMSIKGGAYTLTAFITGTVIEAIPGIVLQIVLIPLVVMLLENTKILKQRN